METAGYEERPTESHGANGAAAPSQGGETIITALAALSHLNVIELGQVIEEAKRLRAQRQEEERGKLLEGIRENMMALGLSKGELAHVLGFSEVRHSGGSGSRRNSRGAGSRGRVPAKFASPDGQTWSGRGRPPNWLAELEAKGKSREEFRVRT